MAVSGSGTYQLAAGSTVGAYGVGLAYNLSTNSLVVISLPNTSIAAAF